MFDISPLLADAREDASAEVVGRSSQQAAFFERVAVGRRAIE
jgi:hypothetical protein